MNYISVNLVLLRPIQDQIAIPSYLPIRDDSFLGESFPVGLLHIGPSHILVRLKETPTFRLPFLRQESFGCACRRPMQRKIISICSYYFFEHVSVQSLSGQIHNLDDYLV
jgi:hypothetical protein